MSPAREQDREQLTRTLDVYRDVVSMQLGRVRDGGVAELGDVLDRALRQAALLASVDPAKHHVYTRDGDYVPYDILVVATGARSREAVPGALTFRGPMSAGVVEQAVGRIAADPSQRLVFAAPPGVRWLLPLYELALLSAATLRDRGVADPDVVVATGEHEPIEVFGPAA